MRQKLLASAALGLGVALAAPASADILVTGTVTYDKDVFLTEFLTKFKLVDIDAVIDRDGSTAAQSNAVNNQRIGGPGPGELGEGFVGNVHTYSHFGVDPPLNLPFVRLFNGLVQIDYVAHTSGSVNGNAGATQYNQDVGVGSNQANLISAAVTEDAQFLEANNSAAQYSFFNSVNVNGARNVGTPEVPVLAGPGLVHVAIIQGSVNTNVGVTQVNQNAGVFNNQLNSMSLAFTFGATRCAVAAGTDCAVALAESDLGQWNANQTVREVHTSKIAAISGSVNFNVGVVMGNQAAGYLANQANLVSIAAGGF